MDPNRWQQIEKLYQAALEQEPGRWDSFLGEACADEEDMRREVESLLAQSGSTGALLDRQAWEAAAVTAETRILTAGARLGPYEIVGPLGEGGMGKVYRAIDKRLDRAVAIKVSAEQFSTRFEREARAISALNHPHICTLYDVGPDYLVMELVEGETLAQRMERIGPLPLQEALEIGSQIAEALEAAHRKGIIHRDLKPANVKISPEGGVKVLDFGLAKSIRDDTAGDHVPYPSRATVNPSITGQVVGTPAYMSPEQARGEQVDSRADIWAFGCVLYEMLTGLRAIGGKGNGEPNWQALTPATPVRIRHLLRQCLEKDSVRRLPDIHFARAAIENAAKSGTRTRGWGWTAAIGLLIAAVVTTAWFLRARGSQPDQILHAVPLTTYPGSQDWPSFSPDGSQVAFAWDGEKQDNFDIYVKKIGLGPPFRITHDPAVEIAPAWSPDGDSIAFLRASQPGRFAVVLVPARGGAERVLGEISRFEPMNASLEWSRDSKWLVVFDKPPAESPGLWLVSAETGERLGLTTSDGDFVPAFAPDGRTLAFRRLVGRNSSDLFLLPIGADMRALGESRRFTREQQVIAGLSWNTDGSELIFAAGVPGDVNLFSRPISGGVRNRLTQQGEIVNLTVSKRSHRLVYSQSRREMDIYRAEMSAAGQEAHDSVPFIVSSRLERYPSYSPNGKRIAFVSLRSGKWQLWVTSIDGSNAVQLTSFGGGEVALPSWSPDSSQIGFTYNAEGLQQSYTVDLATGNLRKLDALGTDGFGWSWSRDGQWIFFVASRGGSLQLWRMPAAGGTPEKMTQHGANTFVQSLDGQLIYYLRPGGIWCIPAAGGPEQEVVKVNADGGALDIGPSGIYFLANSTVTRNGDLMFYRLPSGPISKVEGVQTRYGYSVSPDGRWLIYTKLTSSGSDLMLVENFH